MRIDIDIEDLHRLLCERDREKERREGIEESFNNACRNAGEQRALAEKYQADVVDLANRLALSIRNVGQITDAIHAVGYDLIVEQDGTVKAIDRRTQIKPAFLPKLPRRRNR